MKDTVTMHEMINSDDVEVVRGAAMALHEQVEDLTAHMAVIRAELESMARKPERRESDEHSRHGPSALVARDERFRQENKAELARALLRRAPRVASEYKAKAEKADETVQAERRRHEHETAQLRKEHQQAQMRCRLADEDRRRWQEKAIILENLLRKVTGYGRPIIERAIHNLDEGVA